MAPAVDLLSIRHLATINSQDGGHDTLSLTVLPPYHSTTQLVNETIDFEPVDNLNKQLAYNIQPTNQLIGAANTVQICSSQAVINAQDSEPVQHAPVMNWTDYCVARRRKGRI